MKTYWTVEDKMPDGKWSRCSTFDTEAGALERLRHEAKSIGYSEVSSPTGDVLVFLNNSRLRTASGYQMRIERFECSEGN